MLDGPHAARDAVADEAGRLVSPLRVDRSRAHFSARQALSADPEAGRAQPLGLGSESADLLGSVCTMTQLWEGEFDTHDGFLHIRRSPPVSSVAPRPHRPPLGS